MFIEEPALESIYHLVDSLLENLNSDMALKQKQDFQKILLIFKRNPGNQADYFQDQMLSFIQKLVKLSAIPNPSHIYNSFKRYLSNYLLNLKNSNNDSNQKLDHNDENEESYNSFLLREGQKRSTKDYYRYLKELKLLKSTNMDLENKIEEYNQIIRKLNDEISYSNYTKEAIDSTLTDNYIISKYDEINQKETGDLMFLINQMNSELKDDNATNT